MREFYEFADRYQRINFDKGQQIVHQGENSDTVYIIRRGYIRAYDLNDQGIEQVGWIGVPGDIFPLT